MISISMFSTEANMDSMNKFGRHAQASSEIKAMEPCEKAMGWYNHPRGTWEADGTDVIMMEEIQKGVEEALVDHNVLGNGELPVAAATMDGLFDASAINFKEMGDADYLEEMMASVDPELLPPVSASDAASESESDFACSGLMLRPSKEVIDASEMTGDAMEEEMSAAVSVVGSLLVVGDLLEEGAEVKEPVVSTSAAPVVPVATKSTRVKSNPFLIPWKEMDGDEQYDIRQILAALMYAIGNGDVDKERIRRVMKSSARSKGKASASVAVAESTNMPDMEVKLRPGGFISALYCNCISV